MALTVQWANGFEDTAVVTSPNSFTNEQWINHILGWTSDYSQYDTGVTENHFSSSTDGHLRGRSVAVQMQQGGTPYPNMYPLLYKEAIDHDKMTLGFAIKVTSTIISNTDRLLCGFRSTTGDTIHVGVLTVGGVGRIGLYVNKTLVQSGTAVDIQTGNPWVYVELHVNKTTNTVIVKVSGIQECSATLPTGFTNSQVEFTLRNITGSAGSISNINLLFDDMVYYTDSDPVGIIKVDGYFKDGDVMTGFNDGTDLGSSTTTGINDSRFQGYRASSTVGQEDRFSYSNILPTGIQVNSIVAVIPSILASSGSYVNGNIEMRFVSGSNVTTTDVTEKVKPFTPQLITGPVLHNDPNTGTAWTRSNVQAIQSGYRVKA